MQLTASYKELSPEIGTTFETVVLSANFHMKNDSPSNFRSLPKTARGLNACLVELQQEYLASWNCSTVVVKFHSLPPIPWEVNDPIDGSWLHAKAEQFDCQQMVIYQIKCFAIV